MDFTSDDPLTKQIKALEINNFGELIHFVSNLPYGRNTNRHDLSLVLSERKGTCSSKHAFLKWMADVNSIANVKLILGLYKMNNKNTPGIGNELELNKIAYIPEAHCYLRINGIPLDITTTKSDFKRIEKDILEELEINPDQVHEWKVNYHQAFLKNWLVEQPSSLPFDQIWALREQCILNLSKKEFK